MGEIVAIFLNVSCIGSVSTMRCIVKPAINMLGVRLVGKRLQKRLVYSENTWIAFMVPSSIRKQLVCDFLIFSMFCHVNCSPLGNMMPSGVRVTITVEMPKSGE